MPRCWLRLQKVDWLLLVAILTPPLVIKVSGQQCPPYYTVPPSWCTNNHPGQNRSTHHDQPIPYNCSGSSFDEEDLANYSLSVTLTKDDLTVCDQDVKEIAVVKTLSATVSLFITDTVYMDSTYCLFLEGPESRVFKARLKSPMGLGLRGLTTFIHLKILTRAYGSSTDFERIFPTLDDMNDDMTGSMDEFLIQIDSGLPESDLRAFCYADNKGYIQTPEWNGVNPYNSNTNSCVTLKVPDGHVIMVSLIGLDLETANDCSLDRLTLHRDVDCRGYGDEICRLDDFRPTVFEDLPNLSVRFVTNKDVQRSGFRLLYSFHPRSSEPEALPNGRWNCSVSYISEFEDHFLCSARIFCSDDRDTYRCEENTLCGLSDVFRREGDLCYRMSKGYYTWNDASGKCEGRGARLADPSSGRKLSIFNEMSNSFDMNVVYLGFKLASSTAPEMYQNTWTWANDTLAVLPSIAVYSPGGECGAMVAMFDTLLTTVKCEDNQRSAFICQLYLGKPAKNSTNKAASLLPKTPPARFAAGTMVRCDLGQIAHAFLACDVDADCSAAMYGSSSVCAETYFTPPVPFFTCSEGGKPIPYSLVCDHRSDCCDSSDEDFCWFKPCVGSNVFLCKNKKQCIQRDQRCDGRRDCIDESDEFLCTSSAMSVRDVSVNAVLPPAVVNFTNRSTIVVTALNSSSCPETHFRCPGNGYCLPVYVLCNGVYDCPGKEDEQGCDDAFTCPGFYRCRASRICLHHDHLCDGVFQCPQRDDELMCNLTCPADCICYGYAFICSSAFPADQHPYLRYLEAPHTSMMLSHVYSNKFLLYLDLRHCDVTSIGSLDLPNLQNLDLSYNKLESVAGPDLTQFKNLRVLSLAYNPFVSVHTFTDGLNIFDELIELNLAGLPIPELNETFPASFPNVQVLNLAHSGLDRLSQSGFRSFSNLRRLDLRGCPLQILFPGVLNGLSKLRLIRTDNYKLCCPSVLPKGFDANKCEAPTNEISSCNALLRSDVFRVFLTFYAFLSLIGNLASFLYRTLVEKSEVKMGFDIFVTHLCVADFLMGVYLVIIGVADRIYFGDYRWNDVAWRHSTACKVAGFLSLLSSEVSAFLICLITLERFLVIRFPLKNLRFRKWSAHVTCINLWIIGLLLAAVPLLPNTQHWDFYSQSGICVPLPITRRKFPGGNYAFGVVICLNFVLFVLIAIGQLLIYWSVKANNSMAASKSSKKSKDMAIARRLLAVVMTDFLCWFPIGLLGILAKMDVPIPSDVNVAMAIFVLPFNSALNPFLYTLNMLMERRQKARQQRQAREEKTECQSAPTPANVHSASVVTHNSEHTTYTADEAWKLFDGWLEDGVLSADRVHQRVADMNPASTRI